ncbi:MAG: phage tail protein [Agarilytica sp.]
MANWAGWDTATLAKIGLPDLAEERIDHVAKMDFSGDDNIQDGFIRVNRTTYRTEERVGGSWVARSPSLSASEITSGTLADARIPSLNASKINAGAFSTARIPNLAASKITSGTLGDARIPSLDASKITAGTFSTSRIPSMDASKINAGTFSSARIPSLPASRITSGIFSTNRLPTASTGGAGIAQLNSATDSTSASTAATPSAVNAVRLIANGKSDSSHTHSNATPSVSGFMSTSDKTKLDAINSNGSVFIPDLSLSTVNYTFPTSTTWYSVVIDASRANTWVWLMFDVQGGTSNTTMWVRNSGQTNGQTGEHVCGKVTSGSIGSLVSMPVLLNASGAVTVRTSRSGTTMRMTARGEWS